MPGEGVELTTIRSRAAPLEHVNGGLRGGQVADDLSSGFDQPLAGIAEDDAAADAVKQRHAQFAFECGDGPGQRRLSNAELLGGCAEFLGIDNGEEIFELASVHRDSVSQ